MPISIRQHFSSILSVAAGAVLLVAAVYDYLSQAHHDQTYTDAVVVLGLACLACPILIQMRSVISKAMLDMAFLVVCAAFLLQALFWSTTTHELPDFVLMCLISTIGIARGISLYLLARESTNGKGPRL